MGNTSSHITSYSYSFKWIVTTYETRNLLSGHLSCRFRMLSVNYKKNDIISPWNWIKYKCLKKNDNVLNVQRQCMHHFMQKRRGFSTKIQNDTVMIVLLFACHVIVFKVFALNKLTFHRLLFSYAFLNFSHVWVLKKLIVRTNSQTTLELKSNVLKHHLKDMFLLK